MVTVEDFSRLVSEIYAAATSPENWAVALTDIGRILDATGCAIYIGRGPSRNLMSATVPLEVAESYAEHFYTIDYVLDAVEKGPAGLIHGGQALAALEPNSEFETDFMRRYHVDDGLFMRLSVGPTPASFLAAASKGPEPFDTAERVKLMSGLIPHLQQALRTQDKLAALDQRNVDLVGALDAIRHGVTIVGAECGVLELNAAAETFLRAQDGMQVRSGRIGAASTAIERELNRALHAALIGGRTGIRSGHTLTCPRPSGNRPYIIHVLPLRRCGGVERPSDATALIVIIDPEREPQPATRLWQRLFGLTKSEAEVALRISRGASPKQISDELAVSFQTVRTHLQHVFDKTDTHRQVELIRLLLALNP